GGSRPEPLAFSSQKGVAGSGLKCQRTTSRTWASSWARACRMRSSGVGPTTGAGLAGVSFTAVSRVGFGGRLPVLIGEKRMVGNGTPGDSRPRASPDTGSLLLDRVEGLLGHH